MLKRLVLGTIAVVAGPATRRRLRRRLRPSCRSQAMERRSSAIPWADFSSLTRRTMQTPAKWCRQVAVRWYLRHPIQQRSRHLSTGSRSQKSTRQIRTDTNIPRSSRILRDPGEMEHGRSDPYDVPFFKYQQQTSYTLTIYDVSGSQRSAPLTIRYFNPRRFRPSIITAVSYSSDSPSSQGRRAARPPGTVQVADTIRITTSVS